MTATQTHNDNHDQLDTYLIRGGIPGRERLRLLHRVFQPTTQALLERAGIQPGMTVLDVACGGGDVTADLAGMVGPTGRAVGTDLDGVKIALARDEIATRGITNIDFRQGDLLAAEADASYDLVYARFILTHLPDPVAALAEMYRVLRPGGVLVVEDVDIGPQFSYPESAAFSRSVALYIETAIRRGGDPLIGPRLPGLLGGAGFTRLNVSIFQPAGLEGDVKLVNPITFENIAPAVIAEGLATQAENDWILNELYRLANDRETLLSLPRIVQVFGMRPAA